VKRDFLPYLLPQPAGCPHRRGKWVTRTTKSTATRADGSTRPAGQRGGRLVTALTGCTQPAEHHGAHTARDGSTWT
jgi:hypothetical protein